MYVPTIIPDVAYAFIWVWLFNPLYGPLNLALQALGLLRIPWLIDPTTARLAIVLMALFQIGEGFVVLLAALQEVPADYYHAAAVDGASALRIWGTIALPLAVPTSVAVGVLAFALYWSDFINPLLYLKSEDLYTLPVGLQFLQQVTTPLPKGSGFSGYA